jgi:serine/threonine-protein kinase
MAAFSGGGLHATRTDLHFERSHVGRGSQARPLAQLLAERGALPISVAADLMVQICDALIQRQAAGFVHGNINPESIVVRPYGDGRWRASLVGFGDARARTGSPGYASPEQLTGRTDIDARSDIWSVGAVLYELVTDRRAFPAESFEEASLAAVHGPVWPCPNAHAPFEAILRGCLRVDRSARLATIAELRSALAAFAVPPTPASGVRAVPAPPACDSTRTIVCAPPLMDATDPPRTERIPQRIARDSERTIVAAPVFVVGTAMLPPIAAVAAHAPNATLVSVPLALPAPNAAAAWVAGAPMPAAHASPVSRASSSPRGHTTLASPLLGEATASPLVTKVVSRRGQLLVRALVPIAMLAAAVGIYSARGGSLVPSATAATPPSAIAPVATPARLAPLPPPEPGLLPAVRPAATSSGAATPKAAPRVVPPVRRPVAAH